MQVIDKAPDLFSTTPEAIMLRHSDQFTSEFIHWLPSNMHIWEGFVAEAFKIIRRGFTHYSARTIIHVLRHHSALSENGGEFKINNDTSPYLARLFDLVYPNHAGLFEYRETKKVTVS
jgi:hypothetical protein